MQISDAALDNITLLAVGQLWPSHTWGDLTERALYQVERLHGYANASGELRVIKVAIEALGEDHVSLGSDFDGSVTTAFDTSELAVLTHAMLEAGLTEDQIAKVMGENMLRVLRARLP